MRLYLLCSGSLTNYGHDWDKLGGKHIPSQLVDRHALKSNTNMQASLNSFQNVCKSMFMFSIKS